MILHTANTNTITPDIAFQLLQDGNKRFVNNISLNRNHLEYVSKTRHQQRPFAVVLSCMDSRVPAELIFDQGIGDIFSVRVAGNVVSEHILASLEYAVEVAESKLILVMGHTGCGAVKAAIDGEEVGHVTNLLARIKPAIEAETTVLADRSSGNSEFVSKVTSLNVRHTIREILEQSPILRQAKEGGRISIQPAIYDIASGEVQFHHQLEPVAAL